MSDRPGLVPLECPRCATPVPAEADEVAWICGNCGAGLALDEASGLELRPVHFAMGGADPRPFWVAAGRVRVSRRASYGRDAPPDPRWASPVQFVLPAFSCGVDEAVAWGVRWLNRPPELRQGERGSLQGVTRLPTQLAPLAHFVVLTIEADRKDKLEAIDFAIDLEVPELWVLPTRDG